MLVALAAVGCVARKCAETGTVVGNMDTPVVGSEMAGVMMEHMDFIWYYYI